MVTCAQATFDAMTPDERRAALRFHETAEDDGSYDVPASMRTRLRELGLIRHAGGSRFAETDLMMEMLPLLDTIGA